MRRHGLSWALLALALSSLAAGAAAGWNEYAEVQAQHGAAAAFGAFLASNWAFQLVGSLWDEFFFGALFVWLSKHLVHEDSPESRDGQDRLEAKVDLLDARLDGLDAALAGLREALLDAAAGRRERQP